MRITSTTTLGVLVSLYAAVTTAQISFSPRDSDDIKFRWGVPKDAVDYGSGDFYFQIDAPDKYAWVGLGIGNMMRNAEIVVMFQDGEGNVTLSTRAGRHHSMPEYTERANVQLIEGSGVRDGRMVANVRYSNSQSLDLAGQNRWIAAWSRGDAFNSTNPFSNIFFHEGKTILEVDFAKARVALDRNPFIGSTHQINQGVISESDDSDKPDKASETDKDDKLDDSAVVELDITKTKQDALLIAHGAIMTSVFVVLYPVGALLMQLLGKWYLHSTSQILAWLLMWVGLALGITYARQVDLLGKQTHTRLGLTVVVLLSVQPFLGYLHHRRYTQNGGRGMLKHIHIWYGRILMVMGIVNGGLGLQLAGQTTGIWAIAYSVVGGVLGASYMGSVIFSTIKNRRKNGVDR
ncbi:hypothetical protein FZEAL_3100 [Fusarium zealandicum]|uniref:DOMON domain-containing protein n=1 Tax=Fusarium zealandicum TaxID=1053134 RepID=A0A8H4UQ69_9HYPO|nr:hypothetical protein FZEAL_3100 [Fusarium zealandicum]